MAQLIKAVVDTQKNSYKSIGQVNAGDDLELELEVKMNGQSIEFINPECELLIKKSDKNKVRQLKDIRYEEGKFKIKVDEQGVTYPGIVTNQLVINDEGRVSTCLFYFMVGTSLDKEILQSISKIETLEQLDEYVVTAFANLEEYEKRLIAGDSAIRKLNDDMIAAEKVRDAAEAKRQENYNTAEAGRNTKYASSETDRDNRYREAEDSRDQLYLQEKIARNNKFNLEKEDRENNFNALKTKMEDATNTSKTEEGKRAVVFSDLREAMEFLKATMTQNNNDMVDNEAERIAAELQRQANFETMQQENNSFKERIDAQYEQINTKVISVEERVQAIEENGVGGENASVKKLIVKYVHDVGEIINITDLDISTGIFTTDTDISAYSGNVTPVKKDGVNYLTSSHIPKELQNLSNTRISIVSSNTFKCGSISVYSKQGDFSKYGIMANGVSSIKLENAFQPNRRYEIEIDTSTTDYVTGISLINSVSGFKPELGQTIGGEQYNSYLTCLGLSNVQGINGISHRIKLNNYTTCFELLCTSFSSGLKADTEVNKQVSFIYKYNGKPMEHFSYCNFRNLIPKGTTIKIYDLGEIESEG